MRRLLIILAAVLLLMGCGASADDTDPFAGTWRLYDDSTIVISVGAGHYRVLAAGPGMEGVVELGAFQRQGDSLTGANEAGETYRFTLTKDPGELATAALEKGMTKPAHVTVTKVSDGTASPTPAPLQ